MSSPPPNHPPFLSIAADTVPVPVPPSLSTPLPHPPPAPLTEQETRKINSLKSKISTLETQITFTQAQIDEKALKLKNPNAAQTVQEHIKLLHTYNEIRDIGQGLLGMIADNRGVRIKDVYGEFGVGEGD
ncbi:hypothetical protein MMC30_004497 [Trapelia coarctata]|nr:hypothetical protein [Trapelia coarctata]